MKTILHPQNIELVVVSSLAPPQLTNVDGGNAWAFYIGYNAGFLATLFTSLGLLNVGPYQQARQRLEENTIPICSMNEFRQRSNPTVCKDVQLNEPDHQLYLCRSAYSPRGVCFLDIVK